MGLNWHTYPERHVDWPVPGAGHVALHVAVLFPKKVSVMHMPFCGQKPFALQALVQYPPT